MYVALGQGQATHWGQYFEVNRQASSLWSFVASLKKSLQPLTLYTSFHDLYSRRSGADKPQGTNFYVNRNLLSLRSFATSFKKSLLKSDFIHIFRDFIHAYRHRTGADNPIRTKF